MVFLFTYGRYSAIILIVKDTNNTTRKAKAMKDATNNTTKTNEYKGWKMEKVELLKSEAEYSFRSKYNNGTRRPNARRTKVVWQATKGEGRRMNTKHNGTKKQLVKMIDQAELAAQWA